MRRALGVWVLSVALLVGSSASADEINIERFRPALDRYGFLGFNGSGTPGHGRWNFGLYTWYSNRPLRIQYTDGLIDTVIDHRLTGNFWSEISLFGRWTLALEVPLIFYQSGDTVQPVNQRTSFDGFAVEDPRISTRVRVFGEKTQPNQDRPDGPGLALNLVFPIPVGTSDVFASEGQFSFDAQLLGDFHIIGAGAGIMLGWRYRVSPRDFGVDRLGQELQYGFALKPPIPPAKELFGLLELRGTTSFRGRSTNTLEGDLGVRWTKKNVTVTAALGMGFVRGLGQARFRAIAAVSYSPKTKDMDGDGIPDSRDECPRLPEDMDGFEDEDGCMDPDNDNDFIPDVDDKCPNVEAIEGRDLDEDGCTDPE